ncbi:PPOX class F420-dependent oxidoreductase [Nocardia bovistercoris]|uniref:PPOX class F420-dependent oxidoreductase n=1 Tax=Nocardia bovistercoris TaxID=2785916 RepID=A0A931N2A8_9NOCA|nr:PPOX class F420-dependent oxidoreductase [Nocardia bovistercoris]MBH0779300.1 PPOX class F420-dependent oxidoreductase [Nocardia bovistercoris]
MSLNEIELGYLGVHPRGHLATVSPNGTPQVKPVGFEYNAEFGTIDIAGYEMAASAKYRNIAEHPSVAFMVEDAIGVGAQGMRFLEIRGLAEPAVTEAADAHLSPHIIRIRPQRIVGWNVDPQRPGTYRRTL